MRRPITFGRDFFVTNLRLLATIRGGNANQLENGYPCSPLTIRSFAACLNRWIGLMSKRAGVLSELLITPCQGEMKSAPFVLAEPTLNDVNPSVGLQ